jgi:CubicO group peptidase (beta-lactamase class C family)
VNPGAGAIGNAFSFARFFALLANHGELDGVRLLPHDLVDEFTEGRDDYDVPDQNSGAVMNIGAFGYWTGGGGPAEPILGGASRMLQHPGAGGSIAWAELDTGLAVSICHNRMHDNAVLGAANHPFAPIVTAVREIGAERARSAI